MSDNVITLPVVRIERDGDTEEQWHNCLLFLHGRLSGALAKDRKKMDNIRMVLSIDDVMNLCRVIEDKLGSDWFDDE